MPSLSQLSAPHTGEPQKGGRQDTILGSRGLSGEWACVLVCSVAAELSREKSEQGKAHNKAWREQPASQLAAVQAPGQLLSGALGSISLGSFFSCLGFSFSMGERCGENVCGWVFI